MSIDNLSGRQLGQYQLTALIGLGGMGAVYRALQPRLKRDVAVKVLTPAVALQPGYIERFNREAEIAAKLEHAHIVPVYDYGTEGDVSYVVMRLLTGGTLAERMRAQTDPLSLAEITTIIRELAAALDYAHRRGVIHRDIKASNVMFDEQDSAYLVDFGIAKLSDATNQLTTQSATIGTPAYMSPEQWRGSDVAPASDQYALGVLTYALLTGGRMPFEAPTPYALMHKHLNEIPTPLDLFRADLPPGVAPVLDRALAKTPTLRYLSVRDFAAALEAAIHPTTASIGSVEIDPPTLPLTGTLKTTAPTQSGQRAEPPLTPTPLPIAPTIDVRTLSGAQTAARPRSRRPLLVVGAIVVIAALAGLIWLLTRPQEIRSVLAPTQIAGVPTEAQAAEVTQASATRTRAPSPTQTIVTSLPATAASAEEMPGQIMPIPPSDRDPDDSAPIAPSQIMPSAMATLAPAFPAPGLSQAANTLMPTIDATSTRRATATPATPIAQAIRALIVREGPASSYPVIGRIEADEQVEIVGISEDGAWFQVSLNAEAGLGWIAASSASIETAGDLRAVSIALAPSPTATITASRTTSPTRTASPTLTPSSTLTASATASERPTETDSPTRAASRTPRPSPTTTQIAPGFDALAVGVVAAVSVTDDGLRMRESPSLDAAVVETLQAGTLVVLLDEPQQAEGYRWWQVQAPSGLTGWTVDFAEGVPTLFAFSTEILWPDVIETPAAPPDCPNALDSRLSIGAFGHVSGEDPRPLNVRANPGVNFRRLAQLDTGQIFFVVGGGVCDDTRIWWRIIFGRTRRLGWIAEGGEIYFVEPISGAALEAAADAAGLRP